MKKTCVSKPCDECPFRRDSMAGWIGAHESANEIIEIVNYDGHFPCHLTVDYDDPNWREKASDAPHCAGALIFMNNSCKKSRDPEISAMQDELGRSDEVFSFRHEMTKHHDDEHQKTNG